MNKEEEKEEEVVAFVNFSHVHFYQDNEINYATHISNTTKASRGITYVHVWRCNCKRIKT